MADCRIRVIAAIFCAAISGDTVAYVTVTLYVTSLRRRLAALARNTLHHVLPPLRPLRMPCIIVDINYGQDYNMIYQVCQP